jgi:hypothetical protein
MTEEQILYALESMQWAIVGFLLGLGLRPVFHPRGTYHRRAHRRDQ